MRGRLSAAAICVALILTGCGGESRSPNHTATPSGPVFIPRTEQPTVAPLACRPAPDGLVDTIDAAFTGGEHLEHAQAVGAPNGVTYVGGNIMDAVGKKLSSQDTWALVGGDLYALTSDARRRTAVPDGRDLRVHYLDWSKYSDAVNRCVGDVERAENQNRPR